jgi:hypothetical protein
MRLFLGITAGMTNQRAARLHQLIDNDADTARRERIFLITIQDYIAENKVGAPQFVDWCEEADLARTMIKIADLCFEAGRDVLVGCLSGVHATDDDWREVCEHLDAQEDLETAKDPATWQQFDDNGDVVPPRSAQQTEFQWEDIAMNPDVLECHPAQPIGDAKDICETCGGTGTVKHPIIKNYFGDCPDCSGDDIVM